VDNCTTRLRLQVKDTSVVNQDKIKATGVPGLKVINKENIQVIVGTEVQFVADEMHRLQGQPVQTVKVEEVATETKSAVVEKEQDIYAIADGQLIPINEVSDEVFSSKMMGDG